MASPQKENGYTQVAHEILEHLCFPGITGSEYRILLVVIRKTYGFKKKKDYISISQFQKLTGMNRAQAVRTVKALVSKRILVKDGSTYKFNKNWEEWVVSKRIPSIQTDTVASIQLDTKNSIQTDTHKRKKETITKETADITVFNKKLFDDFKEITGRTPEDDPQLRARYPRLIRQKSLKDNFEPVKAMRWAWGYGWKDQKTGEWRYAWRDSLRTLRKFYHDIVPRYLEERKKAEGLKNLNEVKSKAFPVFPKL